ncbi:hypothetical protein [Maricaulis sp.]|uniref:hypothetical protein n=1 Tax=Maricaulis sp. TaxID=1486257 RepID=UPI003A955399
MSDEILEMEEFTRSRGIVVPETVRTELPLLLQRLSREPLGEDGDDPDGHSPRGSRRGRAANMDWVADNLPLALKVHQDLRLAIAPATPGTIRASSLRHNPILTMIGGAGLVALVVLLGIKALAGTDPDAPDQLVSAVLRLCGAGLGATLFAFWTARNYLRDGTFRPEYNQQYLVRFVVGILSGFILGEIVGGYQPLADVAGSYGVLGIALVGGFSAEAVVQILQRIADILVAAVRGSDWERARADAEAESSRRLTEAAAQLQDAMNESDEHARDTALHDIATRLRQG